MLKGDQEKMNEETLIVAIILISLFAGFLTWEDKKWK